MSTPAVDATRRTRLANERTFLSWWRTALGTQGVAVAIGKVIPEVSEGPHWPYVALGTLLALLGARARGDRLVAVHGRRPRADRRGGGGRAGLARRGA